MLTLVVGRGEVGACFIKDAGEFVGFDRFGEEVVHAGFDAGSSVT